jgi:hypothetical protein
MTSEGWQMSKTDPEAIVVGVLILVVAILWAVALFSAANPTSVP